MKSKTNKSKLLVAALSVIGLQLISIPSSNAQELYKAFFNAVGISSNQTGLVYYQFNNRDLIRRCANEQGITNLMGLSLVYDRTADTLEVVSGTNNTVVCTPMTFVGGTSLSNTNGTKVQRLTWVYWETNQIANGTMLAGEKTVFTPTNTIASFNLDGQLQFAVAEGTNRPVIYLGNLEAGSGSCDFGQQDDHEDDHGKGHEGDHGKGHEGDHGKAHGKGHEH